jgi:hypothetical protein
MPLFAIDLGHWPGITDYKQRIAAQPREAKIPIVA